MSTGYRKKLIEVALPLDAINAESAREKSIRHGHPSTLHLWWARRPLATARAVLFASLVDDPGNDLSPDEAKSARERLFNLIKKLVKWENSNDVEVLSEARAEILKSTRGAPPPIVDPFAGGGSIPLEAQRLGLEAYASDLNPVAVLINKALIELPPKFRDHRPVNPDGQQGLNAGVASKSALAEDVHWYGSWIRDEARKRIGHLYPKGPNGEKVIAWLWARTVKCPNPACGAQMPLVRSFALSTKKGKEVWVQPIADQKGKTVRFEISQSSGVSEGTVNRLGATCLVCGNPVPLEYVRAEGQAGKISTQLMAIAADGISGRIYLPPNEEHKAFAEQAQPKNVPETDLPKQALGFRVQLYGMTHHRDLFTSRQLVALSTFSDLVQQAHTLLLEHSGGDKAYADAVVTYLAFAVDRMADRHSTLTRWDPNPSGYAPKIASTFARQVLPMVWDFTEGNPFSESSGNLSDAINWVCEVIERLPVSSQGSSNQLDAATSLPKASFPLISTDPPYYDNVPYADLSDYFYVWLRRSLGNVYPDLFSTVLVPKSQELVADQFRHGDRGNARRFFEEGLKKVFKQLRAAQHPDYPLTVYYAYKQAESEAGKDDVHGNSSGSASTGWETMLEGLLQAGFRVTGTWPMRTELSNRMRGLESNALGSSIVLVCRPRPVDAPIATRHEFEQVLKRELPDALDLLIKGTINASPIAPVDLGQAAIGPGMAVFSRYSQVLDYSGNTMRVRAALEFINKTTDSYLFQQVGEQDNPTRFCVAWYRAFGISEGPFSAADTISKTHNVDIAILARLNLLVSRAGKVQLVPARDYPTGLWNPAITHQITTWEATHRLVASMAANQGGVAGAGAIARQLGGKAEDARSLAYLLYNEANRQKLTAEAQDYNDLVISWPDIQKAAQKPEQGTLL